MEGIRRTEMDICCVFLNGKETGREKTGKVE